MSTTARSDLDIRSAVESDSLETNEKSPGLHINEKAGTDEPAETWIAPEEWLERFKSEYTGQHGGETLPPGSDPDRVAEAIFTMSVSQSVDRLRSIIVDQAQDYSFDTVLMRRCKDLVEGREACAMKQEEWEYYVCRTAGLIHNWSPYTEVRAVTLPYDDTDETCESVRAWVLGMFWVIVCTSVNTCEPELLLYTVSYAQCVRTFQGSDKAVWCPLVLGNLANRVLHSLRSPPAGHINPWCCSATAPGAHGPPHGEDSPRLGLDHPRKALHPQPRALDGQGAVVFHNRVLRRVGHRQFYRTTRDAASDLLQPALGQLRLCYYPRVGEPDLWTWNGGQVHHSRNTRPPSRPRAGTVLEHASDL